MKRSVDPSIYDKDYFLSEEYGGADSFKNGSIDKRFYEEYLDADIRPGDTVLDIGCGKGEMVYICAQNGASATGVDYSRAAIDIAIKLKDKLPHGKKDLADYMVVSDFDLPFSDNSFDKILLLDVAEHLYPDESASCLSEAKRLLKPGGLIYVDTSPNRMFNDYTYPFWERPLNRLINRIFKTKFITREARRELDKITHVNEHTIFSLQRYFKKAGFSDTKASMDTRKVIPRKMPSKKGRYLKQ